jgi:hypothetical protein
MSNVKDQLLQQIGVYQARIGALQGVIATLDSLPDIDEQLIAAQPANAQPERAGTAAGNATGKSVSKAAGKTTRKATSKAGGDAAKTAAKKSTQVAASNDGTELPRRKRGRPTNAEKAARAAAEQAAKAAGQSAQQSVSAGHGDAAGQKKSTAQQASDAQSTATAPNKRGRKPKSATAQQTGAAANDNKQQSAGNNAAGSRGDVLPDTGEDFWLDLVGKEPQNHDQIFRAAIERIAGANPSAMTPAMEQKLQARMENNLREMTKNGVLKSEGRGGDKTFVRQ